MYIALFLYLPLFLTLMYVPSMYMNLYTPLIFLSRNSFTVLSSLEDNDAPYDADTCTSKDFTTLFTLLVDP